MKQEDRKEGRQRTKAKIHCNIKIYSETYLSNNIILYESKNNNAKTQQDHEYKWDHLERRQCCFGQEDEDDEDEEEGGGEKEEERT